MFLASAGRRKPAFTALSVAVFQAFTNARATHRAMRAWPRRTARWCRTGSRSCSRSGPDPRARRWARRRAACGYHRARCRSIQHERLRLRVELQPWRTRGSLTGRDPPVHRRHRSAYDVRLTAGVDRLGAVDDPRIRRVDRGDHRVEERRIGADRAVVLGTERQRVCVVVGRSGDLPVAEVLGVGLLGVYVAQLQEIALGGDDEDGDVEVAADAHGAFEVRVRVGAVEERHRRPDCGSGSRRTSRCCAPRRWRSSSSRTRIATRPPRRVASASGHRGRWPLPCAPPGPPASRCRRRTGRPGARASRIGRVGVQQCLRCDELVRAADDPDLLRRHPDPRHPARGSVPRDPSSSWRPESSPPVTLSHSTEHRAVERVRIRWAVHDDAGLEQGAEPFSVTLHLPSSVRGRLAYEWAVPEMKYSACSYPTFARSKFELCTTILPFPDVIGPSTVGTGTETFVPACADGRRDGHDEGQANPTTMTTTNRFTNPPRGRVVKLCGRAPPSPSADAGCPPRSA